MAQTEMGWRVSLSLSAKNWAKSKEQSGDRSAQSSASCRRSEPVLNAVKDRSPALPYPPHECLEFSMLFINPLRRGHLYFAEKGTFLFCLDSSAFPLDLLRIPALYPHC